MFMEQPAPPKLLDRVQQAIRLKHYSYRTEQTYVAWIKRYILFYNEQHPKDMGVARYKIVLDQELGSVEALRAKKPRYLPTVLPS
jgi:Phage integrase, N-terminal SAM-like domain